MTARAARFGRFELLARLGAGGAGEVLLVDDGGRRLALKRLLPHLDGAAAAGAFEREGALASRLVHRNIVQVLEHGQIGGVPYVLMEYVDGVSLHALLRTAGRLPPAVAAFVVREACRALAYLHALDDGDGRALALVHRDVSPSNLLVSRDGEVKLCDFGIAKGATTTATRTVPGFVKGKAGYRSPEQEARAALDGRSDVYAAGVVLFEALTGRRPRDDGERASQSVATIPPLVDDICTRARASEPARRFATAAQMAAALDAVVAPSQRDDELRAIMARWCPAASAADATRTRTLARAGGARRWLVAGSLAAAALALAAFALTRSPATPATMTTTATTTATTATTTATSPSSQVAATSPSPPLMPSPPLLPSPVAAMPSTATPTTAPSRTRAKHAHRPSAPAARSEYMPDPFHR